MGFWIFIVSMLLLTPIMMIVFGLRSIKSVPKEISPIFGYRTSMSMKNKETWEFANNHNGKVQYTLGIWLIPLSVLPMFFVIGKVEDTIGYFGLIFVVIQISCLIGSIFKTESALKMVFDENGNRKNND